MIFSLIPAGASGFHIGLGAGLWFGGVTVEIPEAIQWDGTAWLLPTHNDVHYPQPHPEVANTGVPDVDAKRSLEGRSSARQPSFEAPLRSAPQDEVENNEQRCVMGPLA